MSCSIQQRSVERFDLQVSVPGFGQQVNLDLQRHVLQEGHFRFQFGVRSTLVLTTVVAVAAAIAGSMSVPIAVGDNVRVRETHRLAAVAAQITGTA